MSLQDWMPLGSDPPVLRRMARNFVIASVLTALLAIGLVILRKPLGVPREPWGRYGPLFFGAMPLYLFLPIHAWMRSRVRKHFMEARGRLCTHCAYIVGPLGERGTCPECGKPFDHATDAAAWEAAGFKYQE